MNKTVTCVRLCSLTGFVHRLINSMRHVLTSIIAKRTILIILVIPFSVIAITSRFAGVVF